MGKLIDLTGKKFHRWTVDSRAPNKGKETAWFCVCECGTKRSVNSQPLQNGLSKSCGCFCSEVSVKLGKATATHGLSGTAMYAAWRNMRYRCNNKRAKAYPSYGGRGIKVCTEWDDFSTFHEWSMKNEYQEGLSIDRINNDDGYYPENCRWANYNEQSNNRRSSHYLTHNGKTLSATQWARELGLNAHTVFSRIRKGGLSVEEILSQAVSPINKPPYQASPTATQ